MKGRLSLLTMLAVLLASSLAALAAVTLENGQSWQPEEGLRVYQEKTGQPVYHRKSDNPFEKAGYFGECTWFVYAVREQVAMGPSGHNNACYWLENYANHGFATGQKPRPGAIACWDRTVAGTGHVALVTKVNPDGSFEVWDCNWSAKLDHRVRHRLVNAREPHLQGFIYQKTVPTSQQPLPTKPKKSRLKALRDKLVSPMMIPVVHAEREVSRVASDGRLPLFRGMNRAEVESVLGQPSRVLNSKQLLFDSPSGYQTEVNFGWGTDLVDHIIMKFAGAARDKRARTAAEFLPVQALALEPKDCRLGYDPKLNRLYLLHNLDDRFFEVDVSHPTSRVWRSIYYRSSNGSRLREDRVALDWRSCKVMYYREGPRADVAGYPGLPIGPPK